MNSTGGLCLSKPFSPETESDRALPAESISRDAYLILPALNTARKGPSRPPSRASPPLYLLNELLTPSLLCNPPTSLSDPSAGSAQSFRDPRALTRGWDPPLPTAPGPTPAPAPSPSSEPAVSDLLGVHNRGWNQCLYNHQHRAWSPALPPAGQ